MTTRGERWARLRRSLWQPPRPHGEQPRERTVGPLELFYDLAVVVLVPEAGGARGAAFAVAAGVLFAVLAVLWLLAARGDRPEYRRTSRLFVTGTAACTTLPAGKDPRERMAELGDSGFIVFTVDDDAGLVRRLRSGVDRLTLMSGQRGCARRTTSDPGFVTSDQWKNAPRGLRSAGNER